jgi:DNA modification methylase
LFFRYRERIVWVKPEGYIRISRRSGVLLQSPYPMYYYPDNLQESILIFQKGEFDYKSIPEDIREASRIDLEEYQLPIHNRLERGIAAFPEEIPYRLIKLFSYKVEMVLDPFMGSGTTLKVAIALGRRAIGYEIDLELLDVIRKKLNIGHSSLLGNSNEFEIIVREDAKRLRTKLQEKVKQIKKRK